MPSSRRAVLASAAAGLAAVAGCTAPSDGSSGSGGDTDAPSETVTDTPTDRPLGDTYEGDGYAVTVTDVAARKSVLAYYAPDAFGVETAPEGERFAFVGVEASGERLPPRESFRFRAGDRTFEPAAVSRDVRRDFAPVMETRYEPSSPNGDGTGWVAFAVPANLTADLGVAVDDASWSFPDSAAEPVRGPVPEFELGAVSVPSVVDADEPIPVSVEFENAGDGDGTLRGALNHYGPLHGASAFRLDVAAGETTTWETAIDYHLRDEFDTDTVQFAVATTAGNVERSVTVRGGGTPSGDSTADGTATSTTY